MNSRIVTLDAADVQWPFAEVPYLRCELSGTYPHTVKIDPFPCYAHDVRLVDELVDQVESRFPVAFRPKYFLPAYDSEGRINGYADRHMIYADKTPYDWEPLIVLFGKRIPLHPGVTRYLVAHEYGHVVQWWIEHCRGIKDETTTEMDREYMTLRAGSDNGYGGGRWHTNVGELIANDFRICITGLESDYWPHSGFAHPLHVPAVREYWEKAATKFSFR